MAYDVQSWVDGEAGNTPVSADRLTHIESGIAAAATTADTAAATATSAASAADAAQTAATSALSDSATALSTATSAADTATAAQASASSVVADVTDLQTSVTDLGVSVANKANISHSHTVADMPAGTTLTVFKTGSTWPERPTARADITVQWVGADPSPAIVTSGTGGMLSGSDLRWATA